MSFIQKNGQLVRDLWPADLPRIRKENVTLSALKSEDLVPEDREQVMCWVHVEQVQGNAFNRRYALFYSTPSTDVAYQLSLRLQGFVVRVEMGPLGNWKGNATNAQRAVQTLILGDGGHKDLFGAQITAVQYLKERAVNSLQKDGDIPSAHGRIYFKRRVFTKKAKGEEVTSALARGDDVDRLMERINHDWYVKDKVKFLYQTDAGKVIPSNHLCIRVGDFVDVSALLDVYSYSSDGGRQYRAELSMQRVLRLKAASEKQTQKTRQQIRTHNVTPSTKSPPAVREDIAADGDDEAEDARMNVEG